MKKRIIALVLVVVMSVLTLASCGSFNFAKEDLSAYATFDYATFKEALKKIVLDEGDFSFTTVEETRQAKVTKAVYEKIADAIVAASKEEDRKDNDEADKDYILGGGDVLYYVYYAEDKDGNVYFTSEMKESAITASSTKADHVIKLGAIDTEDKDDDEIKKLIKENLVENAKLSEYVYSMVLADELQKNAEEDLKETKPDATADEIKAAKEAAIKVKAGDKIVISYSRSYDRTEEGKPTVTVNESAAYETIFLDGSSEDEFIKALLNEKAVANVGGTFAAVEKEEGDKVITNSTFKIGKYTYKDVKILWKVENEGKPISTFKYTFKEDKNETPDNCRETTAPKVNLKEVGELTYYVYPVYAIEAPANDKITAADVLKWAIGASKITAKTFDIFEDEGYVYKEADKADVKITTLVQNILDIYDTTKENNEFYKEGTDLQKLNKDYLDKKAISDKAGSTSAQKTETTDAEKALSDKQKEMANAEIDKIAACVKGEDKANDAIVEEYRKDNYHSLKEAYDTAVTQAVQAKVWKLIQDSVKVDTSKLPEKLVKEYKKHLIDSYEYEYYKGDYSTNVSNYSKYDTFDAYLMSKEVLNCTADKIDSTIDAKAREYIVPIVQIYVVSKACEADALAAMPGFIEQDIAGGAYEVDEHSYEEMYGDKAAEKIAEAKEQAEENKAQAKDDANVFIIDDAFIKEYKKEIGRAYYRQLTEEYGEINLRASFQFNKLFYYLTSTNIQQSTEGDHKHTEVKYTEDGSMIDFRIVKYTIEEKADNK